MTAGRTNKVRAVVVRDPDGHFVELLQPDTLPAGPAPGAIDARLRLTVDDLDRAVALYRDALGFHQVSISGFTNDRTGMDLLGLPQGGEYRYASLQVPGSKLSIELIEFRGIERQHVDGANSGSRLDTSATAGPRSRCGSPGGRQCGRCGRFNRRGASGTARRWRRDGPAAPWCAIRTTCSWCSSPADGATAIVVAFSR